MDIVSAIVGSVIGGIVGGLFVLAAVKFQSRRQGEAALSAVAAEVLSNKEAAIYMTQNRQPGTAFQPGSPDPGWLKHSIWDSQLPYVVQVLDEGTLLNVRYAYSFLDAVPGMINPNPPPAQRSRYAYGGWIDKHLNKVRDAFMDADKALDNFRERLASETRWQKVRSLLNPLS